MMETYLFRGKWHLLEDFVLFGMPPSHDVCFLIKSDEPDSRTYIMSVDHKIILRLKLYFELTESDIDTSISYKGWLIRGNRNLLPEIVT